MQLTKHFSLAEFNCNDGTEVPGEYICNVKTLADQLQVLRDTIKEPIIITSGYRTPRYNKAVGGAGNSQHIYAKAADIVVRRKTPTQLANIIEGLIREGKMLQGGLGIYPSWIHYDIRGNKSRW